MTSPDSHSSGFLATAPDALRYEYLSLDPDDAGMKLANLIEPNSRVLDVGCGTGVITNIIRCQRSVSIIGIEPDAERVHRAVARGLDVHMGFLSSDFIEQYGLIAARGPGRRTTQSGEGGRKAIAIGGAVGHGRGGDSAHGDSGSSFIGRDARIQKTGYGDRRDDQNDGDDYEEFDQGETALRGGLTFRCPKFFLGEHDRNNFPL